MFDPATRASRMSGGDRASVAAVDGAAARRFHAERVGPAGTSLVLAGEVGGISTSDHAFGLAGYRFGLFGENKPTCSRATAS